MPILTNMVLKSYNFIFDLECMHRSDKSISFDVAQADKIQKEYSCLKPLNLLGYLESYGDA